MRVKKGKFKREIKAFRTQKIMNSLVLLLLSNKEAFPCFFFVFFPFFFFSFLQHTLSHESDVRGCGDGRKIGDITTFYNFTTNINLSLLHLPVSSKGGKQRHTQVYGPSPHTQWGK